MSRTLFPIRCWLAAGMWLLSQYAVAQDDAARLFRQQCSVCHGHNGQAQAHGRAPQLNTLPRQEIVTQLSGRRDGTIKGRGGRAKRTLTDAQIEALAAWLTQ